jgi:tetratricopeptide (TPR) repeat protein
MLSSTFTDLKEHRQKAIEAISKLGYLPKVMEHTGAGAGADVIESSLNMVRDSVAYVGVISLKYGQTPLDPDRNPNRLSITELEFNEAIRLNRPILLFIMGDEHPVKRADIELESDKRKKLDAFRERAKRMRGGSEVERVYEVFESLEQFSTAAAIAIGRLVSNLDSSAAPIVAKLATPSPALSNIPINVPRHFLGRDEDLMAIDSALRRNQGRVAITALHGLRGVGKTTLAAAYAEQHRADYRATWWIRAETEPTMRADLVGLGVQLGWIGADAQEEPALGAVLEKLRGDGQDILLIYDNAINATDIRNFLPRAPGPCVIVTSNAPNWGGVAAPVQIEIWPNNIGADFLTVRTGRNTERADALVLSKALGGLPLAHEQAAAYCDRVGISLGEYMKRFNAAPAPLLDTQYDASREYHDGLTVAKTFGLAIKEASKHHFAAEPLIFYAALLAPEPIPLYLFSEAAEQLGEPFATLLVNDGLNEAVAALRAFALVDRDQIVDERDLSITTDCIRLHRLVREVVVATQIDAAEHKKMRSALISALSSLYPGYIWRDVSAWPRVRRLDALSLALLEDGENVPEDAQNETAKLLTAAAQYRRYGLAAMGEAKPLLERALLIRTAFFGPDHPTTGVSMTNLALALLELEDFEASQPLLERALEIDEKHFGPDDPVVATDLTNLAALSKQRNEREKARKLYERALSIDEKAYGPNHPEVGADLNNLATLMQEMGDEEESLRLLERSLKISEEGFGTEHPYTNGIRVNLALTFFEKGLFAEALALVEIALVAYSKIFGPDHPRTKGAARIVQAVRNKLGLKD